MTSSHIPMAMKMCEVMCRAWPASGAIALRLRRALCPRRSEPLQGGAGGGEVLLIPDRMRVGHRLAPIRHREIGIDLLRLAEALRRCGVFEVVQQRQTAEKCRLRSCGARVSERDFA